MAGPELEPKGGERLSELKEVTERQLEKLRDEAERKGEHYDESEARQAVERARAEAKEAISGAEQSMGEKKSGGEPSAPHHKVVTKKDREKSYEQTMKHVQEELSPPARTFSKVIHNPVVERTSEVVGSTIARPNAILSGALSAFLLVGAVYVIARNQGYALSGSETMVAFGLGWVAGILFDFFRVMITGKR